MKAMAVSQRIEHEKFGLGVIAETDSEYTVIEFDEHGRKKFKTRLVTLQTSDEPPPKRRRATRKKKTTAKKKTATKKTAAKAKTKTKAKAKA